MDLRPHSVTPCSGTLRSGTPSAATPGAVPELQGIELIVFDWDGTLMDSEARIVASMQAAFADIGRPSPPAAAVRAVIGLGLEEAMLRLPGVSSDEDLSEIIARYRHHYLSANATPTPLFEGAMALIEALHQRGQLLAVATGKSRRGLDQALDQTGLRPWFHATRCAEETLSKPHPGMLHELMDELGAKPANTLMIGDTDYDVLMAHNAGVRALAVSYGTQSAARLLEHKPLGCAPSIAVLSDWLLTLPLTRSTADGTQV
ncbi:MAG: HAD-IA family hydrolase [Lamprobacter sp.]|uniref:HAD family hydrolase n=1 Tax=Lamprobacter sp. TaxID=3100796 RepID=UPI002B25F63C|nr:HAD-IA family hydrolase [Lamprobacter sp.]MEA3638845.1 HAD-IA family hydrolase [Lamprobacter sp.]